MDNQDKHYSLLPGNCDTSHYRLQNQQLKELQLNGGKWRKTRESELTWITLLVFYVQFTSQFDSVILFPWEMIIFSYTWVCSKVKTCEACMKI